MQVRKAISPPFRSLPSDGPVSNLVPMMNGNAAADLPLSARLFLLKRVFVIMARLKPNRICERVETQTYTTRTVHPLAADMLNVRGRRSPPDTRGRSPFPTDENQELTNAGAPQEMLGTFPSSCGRSGQRGVCACVRCGLIIVVRSILASRESAW